MRRKSRTYIRYPTGSEYLETVGQLRGIADREVTEKATGFLLAARLTGDRDVPISSYSKRHAAEDSAGSPALLHNPDLVLLDEPFSGLDVNSALRCCVADPRTRGARQSGAVQFA